MRATMVALTTLLLTTPAIADDLQLLEERLQRAVTKFRDTPTPARRQELKAAAEARAQVIHALVASKPDQWARVFSPLSDAPSFPAEIQYYFEKEVTLKGRVCATLEEAFRDPPTAERGLIIYQLQDKPASIHDAGAELILPPDKFDEHFRRFKACKPAEVRGLHMWQHIYVDPDAGQYVKEVRQGE